MARVMRVSAFVLWTLLVFMWGHQLRVWAEQHGSLEQVLTDCKRGLERFAND
jgi:hypothetical protein